MLSEQAIVHYRNLIQSTMNRQTDPDNFFADPSGVAGTLKELAKNDYTAFLDLCTRFIQDEDLAIRRGLLLALSRYTQTDQQLEHILRETALTEESLQNDALYVLSRIATRATLPTFYTYARTGQVWALRGISRLARTEQEITAALAIARTSLVAPEYRLRETALRLLRRHSTIKQEESFILAAVRTYKDELLIEALRDAEPEEVLPQLKAIAGDTEQESTAFDDLTRTIAILDKKMQS